ncbi:MAG: tetratricopeptide repeat protein [Verrucomicrobiota bacterium]
MNTQYFSLLGLALLATFSTAFANPPHSETSARTQPAAVKGADTDAEITALEKAAKAPDAGAAAWIRLANAHMQKTRDTLSHDFSAADKAYSKALEIDPNSSEAMVGMAWVKNSEHNFSEGKKWAEKVIAINPKHQDAYALLGDIAVELGKYDEAYDHYQAALDIRADLSSYARAAHLLWLTGDVSQAQILMKKAIVSGGPYPENVAWCRAELALMQFHSGALAAAETEARAALEAAPKNPRCLTIMARVLAAKGETVLAIELYEKSAAISPSHEALAALVDLHKLQGNEAGAKVWFDRVLAYHGKEKEHFHGKAHAHGKHHHHETHGHEHQASEELALFLADHDHRLEEAVREVEKVYETYQSIKVENAAAWCYYKTGNPRKARLFIDRAMKWETRDASILYRGGMIYLKLGDGQKARDLLSQAVSLNPNFHPVHSKTAKDTLASLASQPKKKEAGE